MSRIAAKFKHSDNRGERSRLLPDMNITALAAACGTTRNYMSHLIHGHHTPGIRTLEKLKVALGMETVEEVKQWLTGLIRKNIKAKAAAVLGKSGKAESGRQTGSSRISMTKK